MTPKIKQQFLDLAERFANHGKKHNFNTGFTTLPIEGKKMEVRLYFSDYNKKEWAVYFAIYSDHRKTIEVAQYSKKMSFGYLTTLKEMNFIILESTKKIEQLELNEVILDEENEQIKSQINVLQGQLDDLTKQLKS